MSKPAPTPMEWREIETAPRDGTPLDLWAKRWIPAHDVFEECRFPDFYWAENRLWVHEVTKGRFTEHERRDAGPGWTKFRRDATINVQIQDHFPYDWRPTRWMPLPEPPQP